MHFRLLTGICRPGSIGILQQKGHGLVFLRLNPASSQVSSCGGFYLLFHRGVRWNSEAMGSLSGGDVGNASFAGTILACAPPRDTTSIRALFESGVLEQIALLASIC